MRFVGFASVCSGRADAVVSARASREQALVKFLCAHLAHSARGRSQGRAGWLHLRQDGRTSLRPSHRAVGNSGVEQLYVSMLYNKPEKEPESLCAISRFG